MSKVGEQEILTQQCVVALFDDVLGYAYLGNWKDRPDNGNIEEGLITDWLKRQGHDDGIIAKTLFSFGKATALGGSRTLYDSNRETYEMLRYGVKVQPEVGEQTITVWLIDWENPENNDFAIAEEVTVVGEHTRRPDLVLYVNGIAIGVLELKRSIVSVSEGIRQNLDSQKKEFIRPFFTTVQLVMAGNETEGLRYGAIETPEKYWLRWKEQEPSNAIDDNPLLQELSQLCDKKRLLEIVHDFIVFDTGNKKICRHNQYFGVRAAQERVNRREGGVIWHTQGSGKSLTMVWLAKWIRENLNGGGHVLIITDRTELDEQIEKVFKGVSEDIHRTKSGADLVHVLNTANEWLVCSLIHKFGASEEGDIDAFLEDIRKHLPDDFRTKGDIFVFVDECHRTQSGKLHAAMTSLLPEAVLIGFTGTPLLRDDKRRSIETFGPYIHTYKYDEAVNDGVVLDLRYEARDIDQNITSQDKVDLWFDVKTKGLSDVAKAQLKQRWGTMRRVLSSQDRLEKIVADILLDMETRDRLKSDRGNALLVSDSIYSACRIYEMFQNHGLEGKCAIVTSYRPATADIKGEETGEGVTERLLKYKVYRKMLADHFNEPEDSAMQKADRFEQEVKKRFIESPGQMKLLIVVDKLLTGFDAPPATCLYIDKHMQDHGLFQAICRVNRLDGEDKEYGYIIDYKDLFKSLEQSIKDYTGAAFDGYDAEDVKGLLKDRLQQGRERLEEAREAIKALTEPVEPPRDTFAYIKYFCGSTSSDAELLKENEPKRIAFYKLTAAFLRAYANLANEMQEAGYTEAETAKIKNEVDHFEKARKVVKLNSGDFVDMKMFEPAMRHLLDTYIRAEESEQVSTFDDMTLVELIVRDGEDAVDALPESMREDKEAVSSTIENNVRRLIIDEAPVNPKYYEKMSRLLDDLIRQRKQEALEYKEYLAQMVELAKKVNNPASDTSASYPSTINTSALRSLYDNLVGVQGLKVAQQTPDFPFESTEDVTEAKALSLDKTIRTAKMDDWRGNTLKERKIRNAIRSELDGNDVLVNAIFEIAKHQDEY
ncbi:MAG: type I restriction endonuclease subunit R [Gemmatimonadetes bacterium]|nr:type I restriction endonuclease subunit R [Gemmatimonadota bacterium]